MAEVKEKKGFKAGAYAVFACITVAVVLVVLTIFAFTTRYTAFSPEKVAQYYTDTIVQTGDGYNAYKNTLISKNSKYGDFIRNAYMKPYVNDGDDVKQADFVGTGNEKETECLDEVYSTMYEYYVNLLNQYSLDDYDNFYNSYFEKLTQVRKEVYQDEYMDTDFMFGAFESNVDTYGKSLTGTDEKLAQDKKTVIQEKKIGKYQELYGEDYRFTTTVKDCKELSADETEVYVAAYKERIAPVANMGEAKADSFGLKDTDKKNTPKSDMIGAFQKLDNSDSIESVCDVTLEVKLDDGTVVATQQLYVVKIGNSWYVDNTNVNTTGLYLVK